MILIITLSHIKHVSSFNLKILFISSFSWKEQITNLKRRHAIREICSEIKRDKNIIYHDISNPSYSIFIKERLNRNLLFQQTWNKILEDKKSQHKEIRVPFYSPHCIFVLLVYISIKPLAPRMIFLWLDWSSNYELITNEFFIPVRHIIFPYWKQCFRIFVKILILILL